MIIIMLFWHPIGPANTVRLEQIAVDSCSWKSDNIESPSKRLYEGIQRNCGFLFNYEHFVTKMNQMSFSFAFEEYGRVDGLL